MVRKRRTTSSGPKRKPAQKRPGSAAASKSLKERLLTTGIWGLSIINVALIFSLVSNFFSASGEVPASIGQGRIEQERVDDRITVEVLNACGVPGLANQVTDFLRSKNFDVVNVGNYTGGWDLEQTLVLDRVSLEKRYANKIAATLEVSPDQVVPELEDSMQLMVTVLVGKDYKKLKFFARR